MFLFYFHSMNAITFKSHWHVNGCFLLVSFAIAFWCRRIETHSNCISCIKNSVTNAKDRTDKLPWKLWHTRNAFWPPGCWAMPLPFRLFSRRISLLLLLLLFVWLHPCLCSTKSTRNCLNSILASEAEHHFVHTNTCTAKEERFIHNLHIKCTLSHPFRANPVQDLKSVSFPRIHSYYYRQGTKTKCMY